MNLSERGYRKIRAYEGYGRRTPDGGCVAYQERINGKLDIPTIGYGCTEGVEAGTVWTEEQAKTALRSEIVKHEAIVTRLVTVDLTQNEYDALVSFSYNVGALGKSSILKRLNAEDRIGAAKAFARYNRFNGVPCKALIARRADESALFLEPMEPAQPDTMPQRVEASLEPLHPAVLPSATAATVAAASQIDPGAITSKITAWSDLTHTLMGLGPLVLGAGLTMGGIWWVIKGK